MNDELVRTQYIILKLLRTNKATNCIRGMTVTEISEKEEISQIHCTSISRFYKRGI